MKPIGDLDQDARNGEWTPSKVEIAVCGPRARLLGSGFSFCNLANHEADWVEEPPIVNSEIDGVSGRFTSDASGGARGGIVAICLKSADGPRLLSSMARTIGLAPLPEKE